MPKAVELSGPVGAFFSTGVIQMEVTPSPAR